MKLPILGICFRLGEFIPVSRDGSVTGAQDSVAAARRVLDRGTHITTFVEGTRSPDGRLLPSKRPVLPGDANRRALHSCFHLRHESLMAKGSQRIRPGVAHIVFHPPVLPADFATREELSEAVRGAIASGLPEWMRG